MKVLQVNKFLYQFGGVERYMFEVSDLLRQQGHELLYFSMKDERNVPCEEEDYFVSNISYRDTSVGYRLRMLPRTVSKTVYSFEAKRKMAALLKDRRPDVAHLHMISHQISPSILHSLRDANIPTIQSVHEYKLVCPSYHLYLHHKHEICERCISGGYYNAVLQRCVKESLAGSVLAAAAQYFHKAIKIYENNIDFFAPPSRFLGDKLIEAGVPPEQVRVLKLYLNLDEYKPSLDVGDYIVSFGRIAPEKGLMTLLKAMRKLPRVNLKIIGDGPQRPELEQFVAQNDMNNVEFTGFQNGEPLKALIRNSAFAVLPSEWYENSPLVIYESNALGKPVVAARIGGIPENIEDERAGLLFEPGNVDELVEKIGALASDKSRCHEMGIEARKAVEQLCTSHLDNLMRIYQDARDKH